MLNKMSIDRNVMCQCKAASSSGAGFAAARRVSAAPHLRWARTTDTHRHSRPYRAHPRSLKCRAASPERLEVRTDDAPEQVQPLP